MPSLIIMGAKKEHWVDFNVLWTEGPRPDASSILAQRKGDFSVDTKEELDICAVFTWPRLSGRVYRAASSVPHFVIPAASVAS